MEIKRPFTPVGQEYRFVPYDHPFMIEAKEAQEQCAGDSLYPVGIVLVKDGEVVARAANGFNKKAVLRHICPRIVLECKTGEGYDLCHVHDPEGHSEPMLMKVAKEAGIDPAGGSAYMYGHWWACEPCWKTLLDHGVKELYIVDDSHERFSRDRVYAQTLKPRFNAVVADGLDDVFVSELAAVCEEIGCKIQREVGSGIPTIRSVDGGFGVFLPASDIPAYIVREHPTVSIAHQIRNVLKQL
jgi:deoxycytidylate deaminase